MIDVNDFLKKLMKLHRLRQQQLQSEEDSKWLQKEESNLKKRLSITNSFGSDEGSTGEVHEVAEAVAEPISGLASPSGATSGSNGRPLVMKVRRKDMFVNKLVYILLSIQEVKPTPTASLDRTNDHVYTATTSVVKAVMALSKAVQQQQSGLYLENVKTVGFELRELLKAVDLLVPALPTVTHKEVKINYCRQSVRLDVFIALLLFFS